MALSLASTGYVVVRGSIGGAGTLHLDAPEGTFVVWAFPFGAGETQYHNTGVDTKPVFDANDNITGCDFVTGGPIEGVLVCVGK